MPPLVSVILPVYNGARFVAEAVASVRAQTFTDWEVLAVDDGSTDASAAILRGQAEHLAAGRFTLLQQANLGLARARNTAVAAARGEWVALLDADDAWEPDYLSTLLAALSSAPGAVAAFAGWQYMDAAGRRLPQAVVLPASAAAHLPETLLYQNALVPSGAVVQRAALLAAGDFDPALTGLEDWDMWLRLAPRGRFVLVSRALVRYRTHADNMSHKLETMEAKTLLMFNKHLGPLPADPAAGSARQRHALGALYLNSALGYFRQRQAEVGRRKLAAALSLWPALAATDDFFYELACAYQPRGQRGQPDAAALAEGAALLRSVLSADQAQWGRACLVLARLAGDPAVARSYAAQALWSAPWAVKPGALRTWLRAASGRPRRRQRA